MSIGEPFDTGNICDWVDSILAASKRFRGKPAPWGDGNRSGELRVKRWPVEVEGELIGLFVAVTAYPTEPLLRFTVTLNVQVPGWPKAACIWRIDHEPENYKYHTPRLADFLKDTSPPDTVLRVPHYHSWAANRYLCQPRLLPVELKEAAPLPNAGRFDRVFRWFCGETRIRLDKAYEMELPKSDRLAL